MNPSTPQRHASAMRCVANEGGTRALYAVLTALPSLVVILFSALLCHYLFDRRILDVFIMDIFL